MKCRIKRKDKDSYFNTHIATNVNHWEDKVNAKVFNTIAEARTTIKIYKLKNIEIEKVV